jgi:hypothetical protein
MNMAKEKRGSDRYANNGSITLSFTLCRHQDMKARLLNYSDCGLCFSSDHPIAPGTTVFIRASAENYKNLDAEAVCQLRTMGVATIKWCREKKRPDKTDHEIGAAYIVPY